MEKLIFWSAWNAFHSSVSRRDIFLHGWLRIWNPELKLVMQCACSDSKRWINHFKCNVCFIKITFFHSCLNVPIIAVIMITPIKILCLLSLHHNLPVCASRQFVGEMSLFQCKVTNFKACRVKQWRYITSVLH